MGVGRLRRAMSGCLGCLASGIVPSVGCPSRLRPLVESSPVSVARDRVRPHMSTRRQTLSGEAWVTCRRFIFVFVPVRPEVTGGVRSVTIVPS